MKKMNGEIARGDFYIVVDRNRYRGKWPLFCRYGLFLMSGRGRASTDNRATAFEIAGIRPQPVRRRR